MVRKAPYAPALPYDGAVPEPTELPLAPEARAERIDAARNREAILEAAQRLLSCQGAESITMDRLAFEAGVGKGTLFRRFGDRAGLFHALLDETERRLQEGFIRGPAPLGPGAPPADRLVAFGCALLALTAERTRSALPGPRVRGVSRACDLATSRAALPARGIPRGPTPGCARAGARAPSAGPRNAAGGARSGMGAAGAANRQIGKSARQSLSILGIALRLVCFPD